MLVTNELFPTSRAVDEMVEATEMTGVEHLGQYVYEMTQAKVKQLNGMGIVPKMLPQITELVFEEGDVLQVEEEEDGMRPEDLEI